MSARRTIYLIAFICFMGLTLLAAGTTAQDNAVAFSGNVKKVILKKNKVALKDPVSKKRFTVVVDAKTRLKGFAKLEEVKKGDAVTGKYVVTPKGAYVATELHKK